MHDTQRRFTAWLTTLVRRAKVDYLRREYRQRCEIPFSRLRDGELEDAVGRCPVFVVLEDNEIGDEDVAVAFVHLSELQRQILTMCYFEDMDAGEAAEVLGYCRQYIYNQRSAAIRQMREALKEHGRFRGGD